MLNSVDFGLKIYSVHVMSWEKGKKYAYSRPYHALSLRLEGNATFIHDDRTHSVKKGEIVFVPKFYDYILDSKERETVIVVHFDSTTEFTDLQTFSPVSENVFAELFKRCENTYASHTAGYLPKVYAIFYEILEQIQIQRNLLLTEKSSIENNFRKSAEYLHENYRDPELSVATLAEKANVSEVYYRKIFKKAFGTNPNKYLADLRLQNAKTLLKTGSYTVERVAYACGFNDEKYFSVCYKKKYGVSPRKDIPKLFKKL